MIDLTKHEFILFGDEHYNPLGVVRSLGEGGINPVVIVQKHKPHTTSASKYVKTKHIVDSEDEGMDILIDRYGNYDIKERPFIITTDDTVSSMLDSRYDELKEKFYFFNAGETGRVSRFMNKYDLNFAAEKCGFKVLKSWVVSYDDIPKDIEYPVITKAIDSITPGWKQYVHVCNSEKELVEALKEKGDGELLVQKFLKKKNELCLDGFSVNQGKDVAITMGSSYNYIIDDSFSCNMKLFSISDQGLLDQIQKLFSYIQYEGIFTIEFLIDQNDDLWFMEINFRNSAWSWASTKLGMNMPLLWAEGVLCRHLPEGWQKKIPDNYNAIVELSDYRARVKTKQISVGTWIKDLRNADCVFLWDKKDIKPFVNELMGIVHRKLRL